MRPINRALMDRDSVTGDATLIVKLQGGVDATNDMLQVFGPGEYETVAASQTDQVLGSTGAAGDYLDKLVITVSTAASAAVSIKDGTGAVYVVPLGIKSADAGWKVTTGAGSTVLATGLFT
jgi:hypothetical protein